MNRKLFASCMLCAQCLAGCCPSKGVSDGKTEPPVSQAADASKAVDLRNTICPVSHEQVGDSKLSETYQGKVYHFCCDECLKEFKKDPSRYANAVAAEPA